MNASALQNRKEREHYFYCTVPETEGYDTHRTVAPFGSKSRSHQRDGAYEQHVAGYLKSKLQLTFIASCMSRSYW
jgi:hypothetical protein